MAGERILIVEDEIMLAKDITGLLSGVGYNVVGSVTRGEDAIETAMHFTPDLMVVDIALTGEMDGIEAVSQIAVNLDTAVVYLTEDSELDLFERAKLTAPYGFLRKPVLHQDLLRTVELALIRQGVQKKQRRTEEKFRLLYEDAPLGYLCLNKDDEFLEVNQAWLDMLGYNRDQVIGKWFGDFLAVGLRDHFRTWFRKLIHSRETRGLEFEMVRKNGTLIVVSFDAKMSLDESGRITCAHAIAHETTEKKKKEADMLRAKELGEHTLDAIPDLIAILDDRHRIVQVNKPMADRLGRSRQEIAGKTCFELIHGTTSPISACPFVLIRADEKEHTAEIAAEAIDGTYLVSATPIENGRGMRHGCIHVARDISDRKRMEESLRQSERSIEQLWTTSTKVTSRSTFRGRSSFSVSPSAEWSATLESIL